MTPIDASSLSKFGNLTSGGGIDAAFDGIPTTSGYRQAATGFIGITLDTPRRIDCVQASSKANGFDASGLNTTITIQLYAKDGLPPVGSTDGKIIGSIAFTDQNVIQTITLESTDKETVFDHVWLRVTTGVWVEVAELVLYEAPEPAEVLPLGPGSHVMLAACDENVPLVRPQFEISQFRIMFLLAEPRCVLIDFHGDVIHTGEGADADIAVGFSFRAALRSAETKAELLALPFTRIRNAQGGGNVSERNPQHYGNKSICTAVKLGAGYHEISILGDGHTDGSSTQGILKVLAEGGIGLNCLRVVVLP